MEDTLYDLVIGNIDGLKLRDMSYFVKSVVTRSHTGNDKLVYTKLKAPIKL